MRQKESDKNDKENININQKLDGNGEDKKEAANRFDNESPIILQSKRNKDQSVKDQGNHLTESEAVVIQLQTMRKGLERKKKMMKDEDLRTENLDALE